MSEMNKLNLDSSDVATILAALRLFQQKYEDCDAVQIADAWPMHFQVSGDADGDEEDLVVTPKPLGSEDIDALCERINSSNSIECATCSREREDNFLAWARAVLEVQS